MATAEGSEMTDFERVIELIRSEIKSRISELVECVRQREQELLEQLDEISSAHRDAREERQQHISELNEWLKVTHEKVPSKELKELHLSLIESMKSKKEQIDSEISMEGLYLQWDESVANSVHKLGVFNARGLYGNYPVVDIVRKTRPVLNTGAWGSGDGQFDGPWGVVTNPANGNIYVADECNNRVQVFDGEGNYLFKFGDVTGDGKMNRPRYIAISNGKVLVSQSNAGCLHVYELGGKFTKRIGSKGTGNLQFNYPSGIGVNDSNGNVYVCDNKNNRIQIMSKTYKYKSKFVVLGPRDIVLTSQNINVLTTRNPFLSIFNYEYQRVLEDISISVGAHLKNPLGFCIDGAGKLLISDARKNQIIIFDKSGKFRKVIYDDIYWPIGVTIDNKGRIVLVCHSSSLLIF